MTDPDDPADEEGDPADTFSALGDPLRVDIVRTLVEAFREQPRDPALGFAELRKRTGTRDSGLFRYHLNQLRGHFVEKTPDGYQLNFAGREMATVIAADRYTESEHLGPERLDADCKFCGAPVQAVFDDGTVRVACEDGDLLFLWGLPPTAGRDATVREVIDLAQLHVTQTVEMALLGNCPGCFASIETGIESTETDRGRRHLFGASCETCGTEVRGPAGYCLLPETDVKRFYRRHDRSIRETNLWDLEFARDEAVTPADTRDDAAFRFEVVLDDEVLDVVVDETGHVVETSVDPAT